MKSADWILLQPDTGLTKNQIDAVAALIAEGATVPFMARYRKEKTQNLDEVKILWIKDQLEVFVELEKRKIFVLTEIERQGKLDTSLKAKIDGCWDAQLLEDLYLPFKQKKKTKATVAKEAGLGPLADELWSWAHEPQSAPVVAFKSRVADVLPSLKGVETVEKAIEGLQAIFIERISEDIDLREKTRRHYRSLGFVNSKKGDKALTPSKYDGYFDFSESIETLMLPKNSHRYLAMRRGWEAGEIVITMGGRARGGVEDETFAKPAYEAFEGFAGSVPGDADLSALLKKSAGLAFKAVVAPSIENEMHKGLKDLADLAAIDIFSANLRSLLMSSPLGSRAVLGVDPGIRTGAKIAVVSAEGRFEESFVVYPQDRAEEAAVLVRAAIEKHKIEFVAVGNGTAGRETELFLRTVCKSLVDQKVEVVMVSESGASVYSASEVAREEFPTLDLTVRGAISIARRLQDPLAELVKVDPKSIGVGQYQHDVSQNQLKKGLETVVDSCVNFVGVNLNTASAYLLARVSGIGAALAKNVVDHRETNGLYKSRFELLTVPRFSQKAFEQAAGFLRIPGGDNPLDNTGVHPEVYPVLDQVMRETARNPEDFLGEGAEELFKVPNIKDRIGELTLKDIVQELKKPGRDPRPSLSIFKYRDDIAEIKDLKEGMVCPGVVTNVTHFGAFVDIGVHQDGLVHISQLADDFVKDPRDVVKPGDQVVVTVLGIDLQKKQLALTMKKGERSERKAQPRIERDYQPRQQAGGSDRGQGRPQNRPQNMQNNRPYNSPQNRSQNMQQNRSQNQPQSQPAHRSGQNVQRSQFSNQAFAGLKDLLKSSTKNQKSS